MSKKEIEQIREDLELLKTNELIEIIIDQDQQLKKYQTESEVKWINTEYIISWLVMRN